MDNKDTRTTEQVLAILSDYLGVPVEELQPEKSLEEIGADSLDFVEIVFELEEKLGIKAEEDLPALRAKIRSVGDVLSLTLKLVAEKQS